MRNTIRALDLAHEPLSIANMDRFITSLPTRPGEYEEERWQTESYCAHVISRIRERKDSLTAAQWHDLEALTNYVLKQWAEFDERPRSSLHMTWSGMADKFLFEPYHSLFSSGRVSFVPEQTTHEGKIVLVDFPMLQYGETGRLINVLMKLVWQRAWLRRDLESSDAPVFCFADEFQYFLVPRFDNMFQQTCRGSRCAVVCLTQNILNLAETLGEHVPGAKTKAFLGNLMLKIAHQQSDPDTNEYMSQLIGQQFRYMASYNADTKGGSSAGGSTQRLPRIEPTEFSRLQKPDGANPYAAAIVFQGGTEFKASGTNTIKVLFSRNID